jgi:Spy/CpxP family protein refolding chaperone
MKKQVIAALVLGALVAFSPATQAQEKKRGPDAAEQFKQLTELLALTAEQKPKIEALVKEQGEKMRAIFADSNTPQEDRRKKMTEMRTEFTGKIKAVLTKEQGEKYDKYLAEAAAKRKKQ